MRLSDCGAVLFLLVCGVAFGQAPSVSVDQEWRSYGHDPGGMRFSPLKQINQSNTRASGTITITLVNSRPGEI
jgi:hypothetical protein